MFIGTLVTVATASIVGSLHCAAMCGGLVSFTCGTSDNPKLAQASYHLGRLGVYSTLGALAGYAGRALNQTTNMAGVQNTTALLAGGFMVAWALGTLIHRLWLRRRPGDVSGQAPVRFSAQKPAVSRLSTWLARIHRMPAGARGLFLGLTSAVLPCGWLYAFVASAAAQGTPALGATLMAAFWLGTLPMLVGLGGIVSLLGAKARRYLPQLSTLVLLVLGLTTLVLRRPLGAPAPWTQDSADLPASHHHCH